MRLFRCKYFGVDAGSLARTPSFEFWKLSRVKSLAKRGLLGCIVEDNVTPREWQPLSSATHATHDPSKRRQSLQNPSHVWQRVVVKASERCYQKEAHHEQQTWPGPWNGDAIGNPERRASKC